MMSEQEQNEKKQKKPFDKERETHTKKDFSRNQGYFEHIRQLLENSKRLREKPKKEKARITEILKQKDAEIKRLKKSKDKQALNLAKADKQFLKTALRDLPILKLEIESNIIKLSTILITRIKMPYDVITDFSFAPLPSQRGPNNSNGNGKNNGKNNGNQKENNQNQNKNKSPEEIEKHNKNRHLYNLTRKGRNDKLQPKKKRKMPRTNQTQQNVSLSQLSLRDTGRF
jgi:hypothetical protein